MRRYKGTVKNNTVILDSGTSLPDGTEVQVRVPRKRTEKKRQEAFKRIRRSTKTSRSDSVEIPEKERKRRQEIVQRILDHQIEGPVGMAEIIEEDKRERDERWDYLFGGAEDAKKHEPPADR